MRAWRPGRRRKDGPYSDNGGLRSGFGLVFRRTERAGRWAGSSERFNRDTWVSRATNVDGLDGPFAEPNRAIAVVGWAGSDGGQASGRHRHDHGYRARSGDPRLRPPTLTDLCESASDRLATRVRSALGRLATRV